MYIKVHKNGNQWFRDDNGALLGQDISEFAECSYVQIKDTKVPILKGYLDEKGLFIPLCIVTPTMCDYQCALFDYFKKPPITCPSIHSEEPTLGLYANIPYYLKI